jgi:hypothetical protein
MDKSDTIFLVFSVACFFVLGFCISSITQNKQDSVSEESINIIPNSEQELIDNCYNLSLKESSICLRNNIKLFYNYTITDDEVAKNMTLEQIKELGTDCGGWAFLYERLGKGLGFNAETNNYKGKKDVYPGHRWAVLWDNETYCNIDQLSVKCKEIKQ